MRRAHQAAVGVVDDHHVRGVHAEAGEHVVQDHLQRQAQIAAGRHGQAHASNCSQPLEAGVRVGIQLRVVGGQACAIGDGLKPVQVLLCERG